MTHDTKHPLAQRFRGFYPVVVDIETSGLDSRKHGLLEIAAITLTIGPNQQLIVDQKIHFHLTLHPSCEVDPQALVINKIDMNDASRNALEEREAIPRMFKLIRKDMKKHDCNRAVMVAHNPSFDLGFLRAAIDRNGIKRDPFHPFTTFDTATLGGVLLGQTVLQKAVIAAGIPFDSAQAHQALYDAEKTAELFCLLVNTRGMIPQLPQAQETES
jgi:ribonuclease T